MSGDVQPRKRKDKKKKKDDLGIEEPRGTAAALGEGDVFIHSHHDHGTGGHWCAKVIFFSLLAVLVTLIGLIILENRGLSELEANSVESRYSGVLDGWIEEGHDDHHDEHTLELNEHDDEDDDDDDHSGDLGHDDHDESLEDDHDDENDEEQSQEADDNDDDDQNLDDDDEDEERDQDDEDDGDQDENEDDESREEMDENEADQEIDDEDNGEEQQLDEAQDEDKIEEPNYRKYYRSAAVQANDDDDDDDDNDDDDEKRYDKNIEIDDDHQDIDDGDSQENYDDDQERDKNDSQENDDDLDEFNTNEEIEDKDSDENEKDEDDEDHNDHNEDDDDDVELEHIEDEVIDEAVSTGAQAKNTKDSEEISKEAGSIAEDEDEVELLEPDDLDDLPEELPIPMPKGRPLKEVGEASTIEKPQDTLAEEDEYERQQEALRKEKEQASQGMWLKLVVGGALLVATHAVLRRATAPRENEDDGSSTREDTPLSDRRMTLTDEAVPPPVTSKSEEVQQKEVERKALVVKSTPALPNDEEDDEEEVIIGKDEKHGGVGTDTKDEEIYSDEEEDFEEDEDIEEVKEEPPKSISKPTTSIKESPKPPIKETPKPTEKKEQPKVVEKEPTPEVEEDDDVEIIEEEDIGEDLEEEDEEEISDVDDAELLTRLEAKYGRLPEPERPARKKDGGNSIEDEWPGEPSDAYWRDVLDRAERDLRQGEWSGAAQRASADELRSSARARYVVARALDAAAEAKRDNGLLSRAIAAYLDLLKMNEKLSDKKLLEITDRALDRMKFRGNYMGTEPLYRLLIRRFPDDPIHRNNLTVSFLMANRVDLAEEVIKETLKQWPNDRVALAHYGFILKTLHNKLEQAVDAFTKALEGDTGPANEPRFYYHLGDSLLLLGRFKEAHEVHKRGAKLGHFLSPAQRSLYNVDRLKSQPWWDVEKTPYARLARSLEKYWKEILKEGQAAQALYEKEKEGLKERGEWSQLDLFVRGREVPDRCSRAPVTCSIVKTEVGASGCRRGQVKFSSMEAGTHVRPHVGPTNCRLRMHLGLSNTKDTYIRVDQETRQWQTGKVLMFDDSFEHEVWHNGTGTRLVLIVDVWHPDLTRTERAQLPAI